MPTELDENSTTEEVTAYAEQVAKEVELERVFKTKSDAQITSEQANLKQPSDKTIPAEKNSGSDDTAKVQDQPVDDQSEDSGDELPSWIDDDLKTEAAAYGIDESELADFASREEVERAMRLFDKSALEAGRKAMAEGDDGKGRNEKGQFTKKPEQQDEPQADPPKKRDGRYEVMLDTEVYDEGLVEELNRMRDHYESRLEALESRLYEADASSEEKHFDNMVDKLGHADLFGKTDAEDPKQLQRRQDLLVSVKAQQLGLERLGRPTELSESLVNRVARMVFAEELGKKELKQRTRKISRQSNGRQGGGATRPQDPREDPRDTFDRLYKELERA